MMRTNKRIFIFGILTVIILSLAAGSLTARSEKPLGDPKAKAGGQISIVTYDFPKSFNYYVSNASDSALVFGLVYESLAEINPETLEFMPLLAESWTISPDKQTFTIKMNKNARWADDRPVTAEDLKFTYDCIMDEKNMTSVQRMSMSRFDPPRLIDKYAIKFHAKFVHFNNLVTLLTTQVLPKHLFQGKDFNKAFNMSLPPGSGPYLLSEVKEGRYYVLQRHKSWSDGLIRHKGLGNFNKIKFKVIDNEDMAFEAFKKGEFDLFVENTAKRWVNETNSQKFKMNWIVKRKVYNHSPQGFQGIALNMRRAPFNNLQVRRAVFHLLDREKLLEKLMFNQYTPLRSYWPSINYNPVKNEPVDYNPAKARELLAQAGYKKLDSEGYLVNDKGGRLEFTILYSSQGMERHYTVFKEDCRKAGIKVNLELLSWATLLKRADEFNYDAISMAWSASLFDDPEQLWHSRHAQEAGGSNLPGYKNKEVDRLIDSMAPMFDAGKRNGVIKRIDAILYRETPYVLQWGAGYVRVYYRNVFGMPKTVFSRIGDWSDALVYWWYDPAKGKALKEAEQKNKALPREPVVVNYDKIAGK